MSTRLADVEISEDRLIQIIRTGVPTAEGFAKMRAMVALQRSRSPRKAEVFRSVLADRREPPRFRELAVNGLLSLGGAWAEQALIDSSRQADAHTAPVLARALGRIASPEAMPALQNLRAAAPPEARPRVDFAISLLAYRHNLPGGEVQAPAGEQLVAVERRAEGLPIEVTDAGQEDVDAAIAALRREYVSLELTPDGAQQMKCGPNTFLAVWNREFGGLRPDRLRQRKAVAGVLFLRSRFETDFSVSAFVLVTPAPAELRVTVHKPWGTVAFAGAARFEGDETTLRLLSVRRPGAAPTEISGTITNGRLAVTGISSATVLARRAPSADR